MTENENIVDPTSSLPVAKAKVRSRSLRAGIRSAQDENPTRAANRRDPARIDRALDHARISARIADDNRAKDILLLDLRVATPLLDFFVIATATSRRLAHAIASDIDAEMKRLGEHKLGMEGSEEGRWILIDYGDFVVHIFSTEGRSYYALEEIWGDVPRLDWNASDPASREALDMPASEPSDSVKTVPTAES